MKPLAENKRARFDYEILEAYEAGVELRGFEVKAVKSGRANLAGSYVVIRGEEAWLINADIPPYQPKNTPTDYDSKRTRRLLLRKKEIKSLIGRVQEKGLTLVPLSFEVRRGRVKIKIALGKSRKKKDKRELLKKRAAEREMRKAL